MEYVGYARVSSRDQKLDVQLEKLKDCHKIFQEKVSGVDQHRPELQICLDYVRGGDVLVVTKLDRLARSTLHLWKIVDTLEKKNVSLKVLDQSIDTSTSTGRLLFAMLGAIAQFETEIRAERQRDGIEKAKQNGVHLGRRYKLSEEEQQAMKQRRKSGALIATLMEDYKLSKKSVYNYLNTDKELAHS